MNPIGEQAIAAARQQSTHGPRFGVGECMMRTRICFGAPAVGDYDHDGAADAEDGWKAARYKHPTKDPAAIPRGVPVWWSGGSHDHGHVAVSAGDGMCWSTDIRRPGYYDKVPIDRIRQQWGLPLLGWTEDIGGRRVYEQPDLQPPARIREGDDMPLTEKDTAAVWHERIGEEALPKSKGVYAEVALATVYADCRALRAEVADLTELIRTLISKEK